MLQKIHCDFLDIYGPKWAEVTTQQARCIIQTIHSMQLIGNDDELYGFVGTVDLKEVIGGYFIVQFPTELLSFTPDKTAQVKTTSPAETVLFVLFPRVGRILLQNRHFQILPISMEAVQARLKKSLSQALRNCGVGPLVSVAPTPIIVGGSELVLAFEASDRVSHLSVSDPDAKQIPEDFPYYNPQRDRNSIIRDSRLHDYPELSKIDLTAKKKSDLRLTHLARDLVRAVTDRSRFVMKYFDQHDQPKVLRRQRTAKFEFHVDIDGKQLSKEALLQVLDVVAQEATLDIPVGNQADMEPQLRLFGEAEEDADEE